MSTRAVITIGSFDGAHLGHQSLVRRARRLAGADGTVTVLAFDPHPLAVLRPADAPARLSSFAQRERRLREAGADRVERIEPTPALLARTPEEFVRTLVAQRRPAAIVEGPDFRFGRGRAGDLGTLRALGAELGFVVDEPPVATAVLEDLTVVRISSTLARWLLRQGRVRDAAALLGRPYELVGTVVRGDRRGRTLGYPTANLATDQLLPGDGVYAGRAHLPDGRSFPAAVSVGTKPMFDGAGPVAEAHLLDAPAGGADALQGLPEYGWILRLELVAFLRDQARFESVPALVDQIGRDCARARGLLGPAPAGAPPTEVAGCR